MVTNVRLGIVDIHFCKCLTDIDFLENGDTQNLEDFIEAGIQAQTFPDNSHKNIYGDSNPDLGLHCGGRSTIECFDTEMLFDPFEK